MASIYGTHVSTHMSLLSHALHVSTQRVGYTQVLLNNKIVQKLYHTCTNSSAIVYDYITYDL